MPIDITAQPRRAQFVISGTGPYSCEFEILEETDIAVYRDATALTYPTHYSVSIADNGKFSVTLVSATGTTLTVLGARAYSRMTDFQTGGDFKAVTVDRELDSFEIQIQQIVEKQSRALMFSETSTVIPNGLPTDLASKFLAFDAFGQPIASNGSGTDTGLRTDLASAVLGSDLVAFKDNLAPAYLKTVSDILNGSEVSFLRFVNRAWHTGIRGFTYANDVSDNLREAVAAMGELGPSADKGARLYIPYGGYAASDYVPDAAGNYVVNVGERVHIRGDGKHATVFSFNPAAQASFFRFKNGTAICFQSSLRGVGFMGGGTQKKTAIEAYDTSELTLEDFAIYPWTGTNSRGLWLRGREITHINDFSISADLPMQVSANPNHSIGCDHLTIGNGIIITTVATNYAMHIDNGVNVTNLLWRGQTSVNLGAGVVVWVDSTSSIVHSSVRFQNIRGEQFTAGTSYMFHIEPNLGIQSLEFKNIFGGLDINGFLLRRFQNVQMSGVEYVDAAKVGLDAIGTNVGSSIALAGCLWQVGATASLTNLQRRLVVRDTAANQNIPSNGVLHYKSDTALDCIEVNGMPVQGFEGTLATSASVALPLGSTNSVKCAILNIAANGATKRACGVVAISLIGGAELVSAVGDLTVDAAAVDAGKLTVVANGSTVLLANDTGESLRYLVDARYVR